MSRLKWRLRVARPTDNLDVVADMYRDGLELETLSSFEDHDGFDGVILGTQAMDYEIEFTSHSGSRVGRAPTQDNLLVFYVPDGNAWRSTCERMTRVGFVPVRSFNPFWDRDGRTFEDVDGYRVVVQRSS